VLTWDKAMLFFKALKDARVFISKGAKVFLSRRQGYTAEEVSRTGFPDIIFNLIRIFGGFENMIIEKAGAILAVTAFISRSFVDRSHGS
jgi:hypothetical protein